MPATDERAAAPAAAQAPAAAVELATEQLDVYLGRDGHWNPEHGEVEIPDGWEFLPTGDAFLTRTVKAGGTFWLEWLPRSRSRRHRRLQGLWAPAQVIRAAELRAQATLDRREAARVHGARARDRAEQRYRAEFKRAILAFLAFTPKHADLAEQIADETAAHAAVVGSGRVGRTRLISLEERARLATRAHIRHRYTNYEADLVDLPIGEWDDEFLYRRARAAASETVDDFLDAHRPPQ